MDIRQMQYILALAEHRSFTRAAKALYISQPSLSAFVGKVEAELGVALFDRSTTPLTLTYAGEIYVEGAREILASCAHLQKRIGDISSQKTGRLRLCVPHERAAYMLPLLLPEYKKMHPNVAVQVLTHNSTYTLDLLRTNQVDMAIMPYNNLGQDFVCSEIYAEELFLVGNQDTIGPQHMIAGMNSAVDISKLKDIPLITLRAPHGIRVFLESLFEKQGVEPNIVMETTSNQTAYRLATGGLGAAIVPRMTIELTRKAAHTPVYSLSACGTHWQIVAVQRKDSYVSQMEKDFISIARRVFNTMEQTKLN